MALTLSMHWPPCLSLFKHLDSELFLTIATANRYISHDLPGTSRDWCDQCKLERGGCQQWSRWLCGPDGVRGHPGIARFGLWWYPFIQRIKRKLSQSFSTFHRPCSMWRTMPRALHNGKASQSRFKQIHHYLNILLHLPLSHLIRYFHIFSSSS